MSNIVKINSLEEKCWNCLDEYFSDREDKSPYVTYGKCKIAIATLVLIIKSRQIDPGDKSGYCNKCKGTFGDIEKHNEIAHSNGELTEKSFTKEVVPRSMRN